MFTCSLPFLRLTSHSTSGLPAGRLGPVTLMAVLLLALGMPAAYAPRRASAADCEARAVWIGNGVIDTPSERASMLQEILDANINTVFVLGYPFGGNYGAGTQADFDAFLPMLRENGIGAHVWVVNMARAGYGTYADFCDPVEQAAQVDWAMSWLDAYPELDGFHLD